MTAYIAIALLLVLILALIVMQTGAAAALGYFSSAVSFLSALVFSLSLRGNKTPVGVCLILTVSLAGLLALLGLLAGVITSSGLLSAVMFTAAGGAAGAVFTVKKRKRTIKSRRLHKK